ncbi:MAG: FAD-binding oxidoreductase [Dehalococcoidia bacterium]|nr:FAD-binding oxidoreductase [Dehalococcoidia bacterium]
MTGNALVIKLQEVVGRGHVSAEVNDLLAHAVDAYGRWRAVQVATPLAVVFARSTEDVQKTLEFASQNGVPVVPYGGGTGVSGGATSITPGIVLSLRGLDRVHELDAEGLRAQVGPGMILEDLATAAEAKGALFAHDPWSRPIASVGGSIAINGVGYLAGKYGVMGEQVLGLEVVLPDGRVVETRGVPKAAGPGLTPLFIGSEGTLGVITRATLQLFPLPERRALAAYRFPNFEDGFLATLEMRRVGLAPALVDFAEEPFSGEDGAILYLGFDGPAEEVAADEAIGRRICQAHRGALLPQKKVDHFWAARHESGWNYKREVLARPPARRRRRPWRMDYLHIALPASRVLEYHRLCKEMVQRHEAPVHEWSLWGRPEYFSLIVADPAPDGVARSAALTAVADEMLRVANDMGGTMEYCHGVGLKLGSQMERELGPAMTLLRDVKKTLDPKGIMNPGKMGL